MLCMNFNFDNMFRRLWGNTSVMTTNLLETGLVDHKFNQELSCAAVSAFDEYISVHRAATAEGSNTDNDSSSARRRRRRTSSQQQQQQHHMNNGTGSVTNNDYFFEHQRMRGYHLATSAIRSSPEAIRLREELLPNATARYLQQCGNPRSQAVAERLMGDCGGHDQFHVEMWAAVQRGKGAYHNDHNHEGVLVSGVYYAAVSDGSAPLVLRRPADALIEENDDVILQPTEGQLVIFPPWLIHGVPLPTNGSNTPRVSFAFNLNGAYALGDPWDVTRGVDRGNQ